VGEEPQRDHLRPLKAAQPMSGSAARSRAWKWEALGRLAAGLTHELNNVLQDFVINVEMAMDELPPGGPGHTHAEHAIDVALQAAKLSDQVALFSREPAGTEDLVSMMTSLHGLLARTVGNGATVTLEMAPGVPLPRTDTDRLRAALVLVVCDTAEALARGGTVRLAVAPDNAEVVIAVSGIGPAAGPDAHPRLHPLVLELGGQACRDLVAGETSRIEIRISP
jgi:C4-dicarboxylate-specific signal transduction histidine kinase